MGASENAAGASQSLIYGSKQDTGAIYVDQAAIQSVIDRVRQYSIKNTQQQAEPEQQANQNLVDKYTGTNQGATQDANADRDMTQDVIQGVKQYAVKGSPQGAIQDATQGAIQDATQGAVQDTPQGAVQDTPQGAIQDTPQGAVQDTPQGAVQDTPQGAVQDTPQGAVQDTPQGAIQDTPQDVIHSSLGLSQEDLIQEKSEEVEDSIPVWNNNAKDVLNGEVMLALSKNESQANEIVEDLSSQAPSASPKIKLVPTVELNLADVTDPRSASDVPVFWHVIRSGGTSIKTIGAKCLGFQMATDYGINHEEQQLQVIETPSGKYLNFDASSLIGLQRAKQLEFGYSPFGNMVVTPHLVELSDALSEERQGRMFCMLRHPVLRILSLYHHVKEIDEDVRGMSLEQFTESNKYPTNHMTRILSKNGKMHLSENHLVLAKEVLRRKFLIGLFTKKRESFNRIIQYFGWHLSIPNAVCMDKIVHRDWPGKQEYEPLPANHPISKKIAKNNEFDVQLYDYAVYLFKEQTNMEIYGKSK